MWRPTGENRHFGSCNVRNASSILNNTQNQLEATRLFCVDVVCIVWKHKLPAAMPLPAHTASDSRTPPVDRVRRSRPGGGWRALLSGGSWWSRTTRRRQRRGTSAPGTSRSAPPCPEARDTPGPRRDAAAWTEARWSSPEWEGQKDEASRNSR